MRALALLLTSSHTLALFTLLPLSSIIPSAAPLYSLFADTDTGTDPPPPPALTKKPRPKPKPSRFRKRYCDFDSAISPECWGDYDINTDYYTVTPDTGVVREYWFDVVNSTLAPDGVERMVLSINGSVPGPTIVADWGDEIVVHVRNLLENNGTSLHFHGVRQNQTSSMDGVASITQCPTVPGDTYDYRFRATQYGSSWYHSHFQLQAWNGVFGGLIIHGPASAPYDEDLGVLTLNDWFHRTADQLYAVSSSAGPPAAQNVLINGTNVFFNGSSSSSSSSGSGTRFQTVFRAGRRYRIRLINTAMDTMFHFGIDNHTLTVIANDFVPIHPYETRMLNIGIGQRYDVVVEADAMDGGDGEQSGDFWLRAIPDEACSSPNENRTNILGVVRYDPASTSDPTSAMSEIASRLDGCRDELTASLVPVLPLDVGEAATTDDLSVGLAVVAGWFKWTLNNSTFVSDWSYPIILEAVNPDTIWEAEQQVIELPDANKWVYFVIQNSGRHHPIHLHGHDFSILAQGIGTYSEATTNLSLRNPARRDVAMLPANGYLVLAFKTDNPGVWLLHCHIGWHTNQGFGLQLIERADEITFDNESMNACCDRWDAYASRYSILQDDSGI